MERKYTPTISHRPACGPTPTKRPSLPATAGKDADKAGNAVTACTAPRDGHTGQGGDLHRRQQKGRTAGERAHSATDASPLPA